SVFAVVRFTIAGGIFLIVSASARQGLRIAMRPKTVAERTLSKDMWVLGIALGAGYILQTIGLLTTTASRSAFLTSTAVIFTPIFSFLLGREKITAKLLTATVVTLAGIYLMTDPFRAQGMNF